MIELNEKEIAQVNGAKFRFHFNPFHAVFSVVAATLMGGPVGFGMAVGALVAAQGSGQLYHMYVDEHGEQIPR